MAEIDDQQAQEPEVECLPQLVEVVQTIPATAGGGCSGTYTIETPLLISTWEPDSVSLTITGTSFKCSGTTAAVQGTQVLVTFGGTSSGGTCSTQYLFTGTATVECGTPPNPPSGTATSSPTDCTSTGEPTGFTITNVDPPNYAGGSISVTTTSGINAAGCFNFPGGTPCPGQGFNIVSYSISNVRKVNPSDPSCSDSVTVRYEGCSKRPPNSYNNTNNTPPGGGTPSGGSSPGGSSGSQEAPAPKPSGSPAGFGGGGIGNAPPGGGATTSGGGSNAPAPSPSTITLTGSAISYPSGTVLYPEPTAQMPPLFAILPGGEPTPIPWNGYVMYPGNPTPGNVIYGATYPSLYISPMMMQQLFHEWKVLKHALLQFDNRRGVQIHTALTNSDTGQHGKAVHKFDAQVLLIYNDRMNDEVIPDLYRYNDAVWTTQLYGKHYSPKQIDDVVSFKEPLLGTSYAYQIGVYSMDANTWKLVGWQVEGQLKGKRRTHSRD